MSQMQEMMVWCCVVWCCVCEATHTYLDQWLFPLQKAKLRCSEVYHEIEYLMEMLGEKDVNSHSQLHFQGSETHTIISCICDI